MKILCIVEVVELHEDKVGSFTIIFKIVREIKSSCKNGSLPEKSGELACLHYSYLVILNFSNFRFVVFILVLYCNFRNTLYKIIA